MAQTPDPATPLVKNLADRAWPALVARFVERDNFLSDDDILDIAATVAPYSFEDWEAADAGDAAAKARLDLYAAVRDELFARTSEETAREDAAAERAAILANAKRRLAALRAVDPTDSFVAEAIEATEETIALIEGLAP
jgi:hypothetical protein